MELPDLPIQATCVRVPVMVGHAEAVWIETEEDLSPEQARQLLGAAPSVVVEEFPSPGKAAGRRRRARRPHPPRPDGRAGARALPGRRQPPQGRGAERDPDRRARARRQRAQPRKAEPLRSPRRPGETTLAHVRVSAPGEPGLQYSRDATSTAHVDRVHDRVRCRLGGSLAGRCDRGSAAHVPHGPHCVRGWVIGWTSADDRQMGVPASEGSAAGLIPANRLTSFPRALRRRRRDCRPGPGRVHRGSSFWPSDDASCQDSRGRLLGNLLNR